MSKLRTLKVDDWNLLVDSFHNESDRGAAILAGSFAENALGVYLRYCAKDPNVAADLFSSTGPLSSFFQRISVAYAFGLISKEFYADLNLIRQIRNHFAHHPMDATFADNEVQQFAEKLSSMMPDTGKKKPGSRVRLAPNTESSKKKSRARHAYLLSCGFVAATLVHTVQEDQGPLDIADS